MDTVKYYWSNYNYIFTIKTGEHLIYNSYSNVFIELDSEAKEDLKKLKFEIENSLYKGDHPIHERLLSTSIISSLSPNDMLDLMKASRLKNQSNLNNLSYTIIPTTNCNYKCPYCFEDCNSQSYMSPEIEDSIIKHIEKNSNGRDANISWFGGEPLLAFKNIESITKKLLKAEVNFSASIITNGYLLTKNIVDKLSDLNINRIQVTIDGIGEEHNKRRPHKVKNDSYNRIIKNLDYVFNRYKDLLSVIIRVNLDKTNKDQYKLISDTLKNKYPNFHIYPGIVVESSSCNISNTCLFNRLDIANFIIDYKKKYNSNVKSLYPQYTPLCIAERLNAYIIGPSGEMYKCLTDIGNKKKTIGNILNNKPSIEERVLHARYTTGCNPLEDEDCISCFMLPQCNGGGCPYKRMQKKYFGQDIDYCSYFKNDLTSFLNYHYKDKLSNLNFEWNY